MEKRSTLHCTVCALIACSKKKRSHTARAADLYTGGRFLQARWYAEDVLNTKHFYILSAKHGLLPPRCYVEPYDESLADKTEQEIRGWAEFIVDQLNRIRDQQISLGREYEYVVLADDLYALPLKAAGLKARYPLLGMNEEQQKQFFGGDRKL